MRRAASEQRQALFRLALFFTRDRDLADDAVQRAVLTALLLHARLAPTSTPEAFLRGIVCNLARGARARAGRRWLQLDDLDDADTPASTEPDAGRRLQQRQRHDLLGQLLDRLPPLQAAVLRHMGAEERTSAETAALVGRSKAWVDKTHLRTMAHVRRVFAAADPDCCRFRGRSLHW